MKRVLPRIIEDDLIKKNQIITHSIDALNRKKEGREVHYNEIATTWGRVYFNLQIIAVWKNWVSYNLLLDIAVMLGVDLLYLSISLTHAQGYERNCMRFGERSRR